jgi:hypothetical protein
LQVSVSAETLSQHRLRNPSPEAVPSIEAGPPVSLETAHRLTCDGSLIPIVEDDDGQPLSVGRKTRSIGPSIRRALERRDRGCRFPGCAQARHVDGHHIVHWAHGGETKLSNLVSLCRKHHTYLHEGGYRIEVLEDRGIDRGVDRGIDQVVEAGFEFLDPKGHIIEANGDRRFRGNVFDLIGDNQAKGLDIDVKTSLTGWDGTPVDYDHVMFVMFQHVDFNAIARGNLTAAPKRDLSTSAA